MDDFKPNKENRDNDMPLRAAERENNMPDSVRLAAEKESYVTDRVIAENPHIIKILSASYNIGSGTARDPKRLVTEYYDLDGKIIASSDCFAEKLDMSLFNTLIVRNKDIIRFVKTLSQTYGRKKRVVLDFDVDNPDIFIAHIMHEGGDAAFYRHISDTSQSN